MLPPIIEFLKDKKVLILGFGREGRSTYNYIRKYLPEKMLGIGDGREQKIDDSNIEYYCEKMYMIALEILNNHHDAEDCVQETVLKIIDKIDRFKEADKNNYLIKLIVITCRNTAINKYKEKQKRNQLMLKQKML